ncbi:hypothetical protein [Yoonia sp. MH D7]
MREPIRPNNTTVEVSNNRPWLWVILLVVIVGAGALWINRAPDATVVNNVDTAAPVADEQSNEVDEITDTTDVPVEDADPDPVPPQDALIPPAPIPAAPSE